MATNNGGGVSSGTVDDIFIKNSFKLNNTQEGHHGSAFQKSNKTLQNNFINISGEIACGDDVSDSLRFEGNEEESDEGLFVPITKDNEIERRKT